MKIFYFTATGNSLYVAKKLSNDLISIPLCFKNNNFIFEDEKIGIIFPIYENEVPHYIEEFFNKSKFTSKYIFSIATYGAFSGPILSQLKQISKKNNFKFSYINKVKMIDNYIPGFCMENQIKNEHKKHIDYQIKKIKNDIENNIIFFKQDQFLSKSIVNFLHATLLVSMKKKMNIYNASFDNAFYIDTNCVKCGVCVKVCPLSNISLSHDEYPKFKGNCISCLACTHNCPKNAIRVNCEKSKARFRNKNISLNEIINSRSSSSSQVIQFGNLGKRKK